MKKRVGGEEGGGGGEKRKGEGRKSRYPISLSYLQASRKKYRKRTKILKEREKKKKE